jgi:hypothetical protein
MFSLAIFYALIGAALGLRFRVMVLMPMIALSVVVITGINIADGAGLRMAAIDTGIAVISLQIGYLGGAATRLFRVGSRGSTIRHTSAAPAWRLFS